MGCLFFLAAFVSFLVGLMLAEVGLLLEIVFVSWPRASSVDPWILLKTALRLVSTSLSTSLISNSMASEAALNMDSEVFFTELMSKIKVPEPVQQKVQEDY